MLVQFIPLYCVLVAGAFGAGLRAILLAQKLRTDADPVQPIQRLQDEGLSPTP